MNEIILPKISVVIPTYNCEKYLEETIVSIIKQDYPFLELIIIDGYSKDSTIEIIKKYDDYIYFWSSEIDKGQTYALIKGFSSATGDIFCWLNSDDLFEFNCLHTVGEIFASQPEMEFIYGDVAWIDEKSEIIKVNKEIPFLKWIWLYGYSYIPQPSSFWRRSLYERVGGLSPEFSLSMDRDLFIRFSHYTKLRHIRYTFSRFRMHDEQRSQELFHNMREEDRRVIERELKRKVSNFEMKTLGFICRCLHRLLVNVNNSLSGNLFRSEDIGI